MHSRDFKTPMNVIVHNPVQHGEPKISGGKAVISHGLIMDEEEGLVLAGFSEPVVVHYVSSLCRPLTTAKFERLGIPSQGSEPVYTVTTCKNVATAAMRSQGNVRIPQEIFIKIKRKRETIRAALMQFIEEHSLERVIVKPQKGKKGHGIEFFNAGQIEEAVDYIYGLNRRDGVVIQEVVACPTVTHQGGTYYWKLRIYMSRDSQGQPVVSGAFPRIEQNPLVNASRDDNVFTAEAFVDLLPLDEQGRAKFLRELDEYSKLAYGALEDYAKQQSADYHREMLSGASYAEVDFIGLDLMWDDKGFCFIEANYHPAGIVPSSKVIVGPKAGLLADFYATAERKGRQYKEALEEVQGMEVLSEYRGLLFKVVGA